MNQQTTEAMRTYFRRVTGIYPELFGTAHVICGNYDLAEYAVRSAILSVWQQNIHGGMGFFEALRDSTRRIATREALSARGEKGEFTWTGLEDVNTDNVFIRMAAQEPPPGRRVILLRYGCKFSTNKVARITQLSAAHLKAFFRRYEARCKRRLSPRERRHFDKFAYESLRAAMQSPTDMPDTAAMYRAFESEAAKTQVVTRRMSKWIGSILTLILALVCAVIFWIFAVISAPPVMEAPAAEGLSPTAEAFSAEGSAGDPLHAEAAATPLPETPAPIRPASIPEEAPTTADPDDGMLTEILLE